MFFLAPLHTHTEMQWSFNVEGVVWLLMLVVAVGTLLALVSYVVRRWSRREGFEDGAEAEDATDTTNTTNTTRQPKTPVLPASMQGEAGSAESYAAAIKAQVVKLQDTLLVPKYRASYENVLLQLDDWVGYLMLQKVLRIDRNNPDAALRQLQQLNALHQSKSALNATMVFLDKV